MTCLGLLISTTVTVGKIGQDRGQNPTKSMVRLTAADTSCYGLVQETGQIVTDWQDAVKLSRRSEPLAAKFYRGRARIRVFVAVSQGGQPTREPSGLNCPVRGICHTATGVMISNCHPWLRRRG